MRMAIISDIHSNLEALGRVLEDVRHQRVEETVCLGDLVGYGPNPNECVEMVRKACSHVVAGNHDHAAVGQTALETFNPHARLAVEWTRKHLLPEHRDYLKHLHYTRHRKEITLVHATPHEPKQWHYLFDWRDLRVNFRAFHGRYCFIGHTHLPLAFIQGQGERLYFNRNAVVPIEEGYRYLVNVGSVGQPRDGNPAASYAIFDDSGPAIEFRRVPYPVRLVQEKMKKAGLPEYLIQRLSVGR
jgi:predicted phosphodiesterase